MTLDPLQVPRGPRVPGGHANLRSRMRRALGLRAIISCHGATYREATTETLREALSRRGPGFKEFEVTFRGGERMRIRCTRERTFADLVPPPTLPVLLRAERLLRPGTRVLVWPCGTGFGAAAIAGRVSPSGAVVALDPDQQNIDFAHLRYPIQNVSFEWGGLAELRGEIDGSFDAAVVARPDSSPPLESDLTELWRLIAPGGWVFVSHVAAGPDPSAVSAALLDLLGRVCRDESAKHPESTSHIGALGDGRDGWVGAVAHRKLPE